MRAGRQRREIKRLHRFALARKSFFLFRMDLNLLMFDIQTEMVINAHVLIGHPDDGKQGDQISSPIVEEELEAGENQERRRDIMTETIFTGEQIEKLSARKRRCLRRLLMAIVARFAENFFMGDRPRDTGDGDRQEDQPHELEANRNH